MCLPHLALLIVCLQKLPIAEHLDLPPLIAVYRHWRYTGDWLQFTPSKLAQRGNTSDL